MGSSDRTHATTCFSKSGKDFWSLTCKSIGKYHKNIRSDFAICGLWWSVAWIFKVFCCSWFPRTLFLQRGAGLWSFYISLMVSKTQCPLRIAHVAHVPIPFVLVSAGTLSGCLSKVSGTEESWFWEAEDVLMWRIQRYLYIPFHRQKRSTLNIPNLNLKRLQWLILPSSVMLWANFHEVYGRVSSDWVLWFSIYCYHKQNVKWKSFQFRGSVLHSQVPMICLDASCLHLPGAWFIALIFWGGISNPFFCSWSLLRRYVLVGWLFRWVRFSLILNSFTIILPSNHHSPSSSEFDIQGCFNHIQRRSLIIRTEAMGVHERSDWFDAERRFACEYQRFLHDQLSPIQPSGRPYHCMFQTYGMDYACQVLWEIKEKRHNILQYRFLELRVVYFWVPSHIYSFLIHYHVFSLHGWKLTDSIAMVVDFKKSSALRLRKLKK